jgi:hypothetical protein
VAEGETAGPSPPSGFPARLCCVGEPRAAFLKKAAYVAVGWRSVVGNPESSPTARRGRRDDKVEGVGSPWLGWKWMDRVAGSCLRERHTARPSASMTTLRAVAHLGMGGGGWRGLKRLVAAPASA